MTRRCWPLLTLLLLAFLLARPAPAGAHADYDRSEPAKDAVAPTPPQRVDVWFTQELFKQEGANFVRVFDEQGNQVSEGDGTVDDDDRTHMFAILPAGLPSGRYIVEWKTTSDEDGDEDTGAFCFYAGVSPTADQQAACAALEEEAAATPTKSATATTPPAGSPEPTAVEGAGDEDGGGAPTGAIVGGIVGVVVGVLAAAGAALWLRRSAG